MLMRSIERPEIDTEALVEKLYSRVRNRPVREEVLKGAIAKAEKEYALECAKGHFDYVSKCELPIGIDPSFMKNLYESHLRDGIGRAEYIQILKSSDSSKLCVYCQIREAESCDHYKEKSDFPLLAVSPANLLPACTRCNGRMGVEGQRFHCYYESVDSYDWLDVDLLHTRGSPAPALEFKVRSNFCSNQPLVNRLTQTFDTIGLSERWSVELGPVMYRIADEFSRNPKLVDRKSYINDHLYMNAYSWNGPHATLFRKILTSDWIYSPVEL
jgi:hypothetical protein